MQHLEEIPVKDFMITDVITLKSNERLSHAYEKMENHKIRHLPVVNKAGKVVGIFTRTDLLKAYHPRQTPEGWYYDRNELDLLSLDHFMKHDPMTLTPEDTLDRAAGLMARFKYGCMPIVRDKKLVGIISQIDVLRKIASFFQDT